MPSLLSGRRARFGPLLMLLLIFLAGCQDVHTPAVVKIGLIAPFEGPSRPLGYDVLNAVSLAIDEWNAQDAPFKVELVALNDDSDPALAALLPAQFAQDPDIRVILGPPQGHTAAAVNSIETVRLDLPVILLGPVRGPVSADILPFAGIGQDYRRAFAPLLGDEVPTAWQGPVTQPVIWLGDPLTLAEVYTTHPEWIAAAGPVAEEAVLQGWAPGLSQHLPWAAPIPVGQWQDFRAAYEARTGKSPTHTAALAYAAARYALGVLMADPDHHLDANNLHSIPLPTVTVINRVFP